MKKIIPEIHKSTETDQKKKVMLLAGLMGYQADNCNSRQDETRAVH